MDIGMYIADSNSDVSLCITRKMGSTMAGVERCDVVEQQEIRVISSV
jgi:hypothetical protein